MKKMKWAGPLFLVLLLLAGTAAARENIIEGDISKGAGDLEVPRGTTVNGNVTLNAGQIEILGTVNGNVDSNMGRVTVHGKVNGDVEANMGQVLVVGDVGGDVVARMGEVIVEGAVGGDVKAELGSIRIRGTVAGDVDSGLGELRVSGEVLGNVTSRGKNVILSGTVRGDVTLTRGIVDLGPGSEIGGRVHVEQGMVRSAEGSRAGSILVDEELSEAEIDERFSSGEFHGFDGLLGTIIGSISRAAGKINLWPRISIYQKGWRISPRSSLLGWSGHVARGLLNMVVLFALAALTFSLFPGHVRNTGQILSARPGSAVGWGLLAVLLAVPLALLLAITLIGIPLIVVEMLALALAGILGYTAISQLVGEKVAGAASAGPVNPLGAIALGVLILGAISMIPLVGFLLMLLLFVLAVGASLATRFGTLPPHPAEPAGPAAGTGAGPLRNAPGDVNETTGEGEA